MGDGITFVGMDVHKERIQVSLIRAWSGEAEEFELRNEPRAVKRLVARLKGEARGEVRCCYEAGPCGYALQREFEAAGLSCAVMAPSLIPAKPGDRVKTDRRDARKLVDLLRAGLLTAVAAPTPEQEAARDLWRCREDARQDLMRARHRLDKFLLRRGIVFGGKCRWTGAHRAWLGTLRFEREAERAVFGDYLLAVEQVEERLRGLEAKLEELAAGEKYREAVGRLRCFRGVDTVTAMAVVTELHGASRFGSARELMAYVGLVPSERSSGGSTRRGAITRTGNSHLRRILIEAAWHYRKPPRVGRTLSRRRVGQPPRAIGAADRAMVRLHRRYWGLVNRGKPPTKVVTAVARELAGHLWAVLVEAEREAA